MARNRVGRRNGFTVRELLAASAAGMVGLAVLTPVLAGFSDDARQHKCQDLQRFISMGTLSFAQDHDNLVPGTNGSGLEVYNTWASQGLAAAIDLLETSGTQPTSTSDWITPSLASLGVPLPSHRPERTFGLVAKFKDPANNTAAHAYEFSTAPDNMQLRDFEADSGAQLYGSSYLMSAYFQWGGRYNGLTPGPAFESEQTKGGLVITRLNAPFGSPFAVQYSYDARTTSIGNPSSKVLMADGLRFHYGEGVDVSGIIRDLSFGNFTTSTPVHDRSTAYGIPGSGNPSNGAQLPLSYRHNMTMNVIYWDGSAGNLGVLESQDPALWYPSGSIYSGNSAVETVETVYGYETGDAVP
ncbi:MAG: hypothetical protein R3B46_08375 [Phycisphaerales bacterium]|nr:hypothetical protein [Phycisphaerales bacterium]